ncbi:MAG: hypothetical protein V1859_08110 [archaeon]
MKKAISILAIALMLVASVVIAAPPADPYADAVHEQSAGVTSATNALGAPDGSYAVIPVGDEIVLDMGAGEEIFGGSEGDDFIVIQTELNLRDIFDCAMIGVEYSDDGTTWLGAACFNGDLPGSENNDFDGHFRIADGAEVRYVRIKNVLGVENTFGNFELDAIEALHYNDNVEVPEFTTIGAALVLVAAGLFAARKRKN